MNTMQSLPLLQNALTVGAILFSLGLVGILRGVHQEVGVDIPQGDGGHGDGRPEVLRQGPLDGLDAGGWEDGWMG